MVESRSGDGRGLEKLPKGEQPLAQAFFDLVDKAFKEEREVTSEEMASLFLTLSPDQQNTLIARLGFESMGQWGFAPTKIQLPGLPEVFKFSVNIVREGAENAPAFIQGMDRAQFGAALISGMMKDAGSIGGFATLLRERLGADTKPKPKSPEVLAGHVAFTGPDGEVIYIPTGSPLLTQARDTGSAVMTVLEQPPKVELLPAPVTTDIPKAPDPYGSGITDALKYVGVLLSDIKSVWNSLSLRERLSSFQNIQNTWKSLHLKEKLARVSLPEIKGMSLPKISHIGLPKIGKSHSTGLQLSDLEAPQEKDFLKTWGVPLGLLILAAIAYGGWHFFHSSSENTQEGQGVVTAGAQEVGDPLLLTPGKIKGLMEQSQIVSLLEQFKDPKNQTTANLKACEENGCIIPLSTFTDDQIKVMVALDLENASRLFRLSSTQIESSLLDTYKRLAIKVPASIFSDDQIKAFMKEVKEKKAWMNLKALVSIVSGSSAETEVFSRLAAMKFSIPLDIFSKEDVLAMAKRSPENVRLLLQLTGLKVSTVLTLYQYGVDIPVVFETPEKENLRDEEGEVVRKSIPKETFTLVTGGKIQVKDSKKNPGVKLYYVQIVADGKPVFILLSSDTVSIKPKIK